MRVTIIKDDNAVIVDGVRFEVGAVALLAADIHAIQWDGAAVHGEIEFRFSRCVHCGGGSKKSNAEFRDFTPYQPLVDAWMAARAAAEAEKAKREAEAAAEQSDGAA